MPLKDRNPAFVNFSDYMDQNRKSTQAMTGKVQAQQNNLQAYGDRARGDLTQETGQAAYAGGWDGDYTKLPGWQHYTDSTKAFQDYQTDQRNNNGRTMELQNEYYNQGGATGLDAALLYRRGDKNSQAQQAPSAWGNYLNGLEGVAQYEGNRGNTDRQAVADKASADAAAAAQAKALKDSQDANTKEEADRQKAWQHEQDMTNNPGGQAYYGGPGLDPNAMASHTVAQAQYNDTVQKRDDPRPTEPENDGYTAGMTSDNPEFFRQRKYRWDKYHADLDAWKKRHPGLE